MYSFTPLQDLEQDILLAYNQNRTEDYLKLKQKKEQMEERRVDELIKDY